MSRKLQKAWDFGVFDADKIIKECFKNPLSLPLSDENIDALNLLHSIRKDSSIGIVQGPPGTGKTTLLEHFISNEIERLNEDEMIIYLAPTNRCVADMVRKIASIYRRKGMSPKDLVNELRIFGSKIVSEEFKLRTPINENTKIVISTEFQRIPGITYTHKTFHLLIDEAGKSPLHRWIIPISNKLIERIESGGSLIKSLSIVGDPQQAIALSDQYKGVYGKNQLLLVRFLRGLIAQEKGIESYPTREVYFEELLQDAYKYLKGKHFELLETTFRLPSPSHLPISDGYYNEKLRSYERSEERMKGLWDEHKATELIRLNEKMKKIVPSIEDALTTYRPVIYVHDPIHWGKSSDFLFSPGRAEKGILFALALSFITGKSTTIITPYVDQEIQTFLRLKYSELFKKLREMRGHNIIKVSTVQKMLGGEDENIVAILGKEYGGKDKKTIYFQEPELLNVQLSRHRRVLVIIGNFKQLKDSAAELDQQERTIQFKSLHVTAKKILELSGYKSPKKIKKDSDFVFVRWKND